MSSSAITKAQPAAQVKANVATGQLFANAANPSVPAIINVPGSGRLEQKKFVVRASGTATTGATSTVAPTLYMAKSVPATPFTPGNWTILGAATGVSFATTTGAWWIEALLEFESVGGTMQGSFSSLILNTLGAAAAIPNLLTGLNGTSQTVTQGSTVVPQTEPVFVIACGLTFGTANVGNIGTMGDFSLDG